MNLIVEIKGKQINYEVTGEGTPVILLHGWLASLEVMRPLAKPLSKLFKVYNVDVIGFGKSDLPEQPLNSNDFGDFLNNFMEALQIENPILIGHSNGGRIILNFAGRRLKPIRKIILIDSAGIKPVHKPSYYMKVYSYKTVKAVLGKLPNTEKMSQLREKALSKFGSSDYKNSPEVLRKTMSTILQEDLRPIMPNIQAPTLLIWGEQDTATPLSDGKQMEKLIPDAGLVVYKNTGHYSYLENLAPVIRVLEEFLKGEG